MAATEDPQAREMLAGVEEVVMQVSRHSSWYLSGSSSASTCMHARVYACNKLSSAFFSKPGRWWLRSAVLPLTNTDMHSQDEPLHGRSLPPRCPLLPRQLPEAEAYAALSAWYVIVPYLRGAFAHFLVYHLARHAPSEALESQGAGVRSRNRMKLEEHWGKIGRPFFRTLPLPECVSARPA